MYKIDKNTIYLTRGDTFSASVGIKRNGAPYTPVAGDTIRFALKRDTLNHDKTEYLDKKPLIVKEIPINTMVLRLESEDTKDFRFGTYAYDIQITMADGTVDTFISDKLYLQPEVV